jgi:hypothetical protein
MVPGEIVADEWGIRQIIDAQHERTIDLEEAFAPEPFPPVLSSQRRQELEFL